MDSNNLRQIAERMLYISNTVKVYHWQTGSYARHIASDALFLSLTELTDKFMEVLQGAVNKRVKFARATSIELKNISDASIVTILRAHTRWLHGLDKMLPRGSTDLLNLRDEMIAAVNQAMYLFTFK